MHKATFVAVRANQGVIFALTSRALTVSNAGSGDESARRCLVTKSKLTNVAMLRIVKLNHHNHV